MFAITYTQIGHIVASEKQLCISLQNDLFKIDAHSWAWLSKLMTSLVNNSLKFQRLISQIRQYFLLEKCEKLLQISFFQQKMSVYLVIKL